MRRKHPGGCRVVSLDKSIVSGKKQTKKDGISMPDSRKGLELHHLDAKPNRANLGSGSILLGRTVHATRPRQIGWIKRCSE